MLAKPGLLADEGAGTILVLAICTALLSVAMVTLWVSQNIVGQWKLQAQTESAALAVVLARQGALAGIPCDTAKQVFTLNMVFLDKCLIVGDEVVVQSRWQPFGYVLRGSATAAPRPAK